MRLSTLPHSTVAALAFSLLSFSTTAHPVQDQRTQEAGSGCAADSASVAASIPCGPTTAVQSCVLHFGSAADALQQCLEDAGCSKNEAWGQTVLAVARCSSAATDTQREGLELRNLAARADTTTSSASTSSTSSTSTDATSTSSSTSASASATTTASSTTASTTASSTASTTSSTASATSSATAVSNKGMTTISYIVAAVLALFTAAMIGGVCFSCLAERSKIKKDKAAAEAKALMGGH